MEVNGMAIDLGLEMDGWGVQIQGGSDTVKQTRKESRKQHINSEVVDGSNREQMQ